MKMEVDFKKIDEILDLRGREQKSVIAILQDIQAMYNYLPEEVFPYLSKELNLGMARLYGVATFYENFSLHPKGKYIIRCCDGTACHVRGSQPILHALRNTLGLNETTVTTDDFLFTVETVSCLGACGLAPALTVNGKVYAGMNEEKALKLLGDLRKEAFAEEKEENHEAI